jgi:chlorobactene glucosyltransferase
MGRYHASYYRHARSVVIMLALSTVLTVASLVVNHWVHSRNRSAIRIGSGGPSPSNERISVCIPARNEARTIRTCVQAILGQTYSRVELIVVDDASSDETATILKSMQRLDPRIRIIRGRALPKGWAGKPHALQQAALAATGEWLCFVDADTRLVPQAVAACCAEAQRTGADLLSIVTRQITASFWERSILPLVMSALAVGFPADRVNDSKYPDAIANGQFILIKREVFDAVGGYSQIRDRIDDDRALAQLVKRAGYKLVLANGRDLADTRMYQSFAEMWEGWTKNIYLGLRDERRLLILGVLGFFVLAFAAVVLPLWLAVGLWWLSDAGGLAALIVLTEAVGVWMAILWSRASVAAAMDIPRSYALTTSIGCAVFAAMMLVSAWKVLSGRGVTWRGRRYRF